MDTEPVWDGVERMEPLEWGMDTESVWDDGESRNFGMRMGNRHLTSLGWWGENGNF